MARGTLQSPRGPSFPSLSLSQREGYPVNPIFDFIEILCFLTQNRYPLDFTCMHMKLNIWHDIDILLLYIYIHIIYHDSIPKGGKGIGVFGATGDKPKFWKHRTGAPLLCGKFFTLVEIPALSQKLMLWPKIANSTILGQQVCLKIVNPQFIGKIIWVCLKIVNPKFAGKSCSPWKSPYANTPSWSS